jgi:hypothetical protein
MRASLVWLEATAFSTWMRESPSMLAFPAILCCHTVGMGLAAGINAAIALRILGVGPDVPMAELKRFLPIMWFGFWLNAVSGVALLIAYPTKALTNPVFHLKLALVALSVVLLRAIARRIFRDGVSRSDSAFGRVKMLAAVSLASWAGVITSGRLLAYTYTRLMADFR